MLQAFSTLIAKLSGAVTETLRLGADASSDVPVLFSELLPHLGPRARRKQERQPGADEGASQHARHEAASGLLVSIHVRSLLWHSPMASGAAIDAVQQVAHRRPRSTATREPSRSLAPIAWGMPHCQLIAWQPGYATPYLFWRKEFSAGPYGEAEGCFPDACRSRSISATRAWGSHGFTMMESNPDSRA